VDAITRVPQPVNEPIRGYAPGSPERASLKKELAFLAEEPVDVFGVIGDGWTPRPGGVVHEVRMPSDHSTLLARVHQTTAADAASAVNRSRTRAP